MLMADTVMGADEPCFQIGEDEMDDRQIVLGNVWVAALDNGKVFIPGIRGMILPARLMRLGKRSPEINPKGAAMTHSSSP